MNAFSVAFGGKADMALCSCTCPLLTQSGHSPMLNDVCFHPPCWAFRSSKPQLAASPKASHASNSRRSSMLISVMLPGGIACERTA